MNRTLLLTALALSTLGCVIDTGVAGGHTVKRELATDCANHCATLDMRLAAVVVIHTTGGCVCEPKEAGACEAPRTSAAAAGGAVLQVKEQQAAAGMTTGAPR
jgi:hypothetical protein